MIYNYKLNINSLYLFKIDVLGNYEKDLITLRVLSKYEKNIVSEKEISLSIRSDEKKEIRYLFLATDDIINSVEFICEENIDLDISYSTIVCKQNEINKYMKTLKDLDSASFTKNSQKFKRFINIDLARRYLFNKKNKLEEIYFPLIEGIEEQRKVFPNKTIGVIGDEFFCSIIDSMYCTVRISEETLNIVESGIIDLVIIQKRATQLHSKNITIEEENKYMDKLYTILSKSDIPILTVDNSSYDNYKTEIKLAGKDNKSIEAVESFICAFTPIKGKRYSTKQVIIPIASDLYQYHVFNDMVKELVDYGYRVNISETNYGHVPIRTWERFSSEHVKVYDKLNAYEIAEVSRNCGYMILFSESLRGKTDLINLSAIAICSGCIPIIVGEDILLSQKFIRSVGSLGELVQLMDSTSTDLAHEHYWVQMFRAFSKLHRESKFSQIIEATLFDYNKVQLPINPLPSVEIICVTKRIQNLDIILESFDRQSYSNLSMHLIWNVPTEKYSEAKETLNMIKNRNIKISILDESYNIGNCLNYGINSSSAKYWMKFDDDDYYGKYYVEDMVNWYEISGADILGKPTALVYFAESNETYMRNSGFRLMRKELEKQHFCGATLSGKIESNHLLFSSSYRNACDSKWVEAVTDSGKFVLSSDMFNFSIFRGDLKQHTWQLNAKSLQKNSLYLTSGKVEEWVDA